MPGADDPRDAASTVFVYGTLLEPARLDAVLDDWRPIGGAVLEGLHRVQGTYPTLAPGGRVEGRLLRTAELGRLDAHEGVDRGLYVRVAVPVVGPVGPAVGDRAWVYVGDPGRLDAPASWPGEGAFADRVRRHVEEREVALVPADGTGPADRRDDRQR